MAQESLGRGLHSPIEFNHHGGLAVARYEDKVQQSIMTILSTAKGERVMRPEFGCDIHSFVFASLDTTTLTLIKSVVCGALARWEPRIEVNDVNVTIDSRNGNQVRIGVGYTIRATKVAANLVYPFHLQIGN
jgi:phage baseplate assembly protein W